MINENRNISGANQWKSIYKIAAISAIAILAFIPIQSIVFIAWPPPFDSVVGWFVLFHKSKLIGLIDMDLFLIVDYILTLTIYIAIWGVLRRTNEALATFALILQLMSTAVYYASAGAIEMLYLSDRYATAATDTARNSLIAAGQTVISQWQGTAFTVSYLLGSIAMMMISIVMLRSDVFGRATGWLGLAAGILMIVPPNVGMAGLVISFMSLVPTVGWLVLLARKFLLLSRSGS